MNWEDLDPLFLSCMASIALMLLITGLVLMVYLTAR